MSPSPYLAQAALARDLESVISLGEHIDQRAIVSLSMVKLYTDDGTATFAYRLTGATVALQVAVVVRVSPLALHPPPPICPVV